MKIESSFFRVETAVTAFVAWQARDLVFAWRHSPYDRVGWVAFLLWLTPVALGLWQRQVAVAPLKILVWSSLGLALAGGISGLNVLNYVALALAVTGCWPLPDVRQLYWLLLSIAWMPILGWIVVHARIPHVGLVVGTLRLLLGLLAAGVGAGTFFGRKKLL